MLRQLHFSELDLVLHSRYTPGQGSTVFQSEEVKAVEARTTVLPPLPEDRCASCRHMPAHAPMPSSQTVFPCTQETGALQAVLLGRRNILALCLLTQCLAL